MNINLNIYKLFQDFDFYEHVCTEREIMSLEKPVEGGTIKYMVDSEGKSVLEVNCVSGKNLMLLLNPSYKDLSTFITSLHCIKLQLRKENLMEAA